MEGVVYFGQEIQFLVEFDVLFVVGNVVVCWDIEIVDCYVVFQFGCDMVGMVKVGVIVVFCIFDWQF